MEVVLELAVCGAFQVCVGVWVCGLPFLVDYCSQPLLSVFFFLLLFSVSSVFVFCISHLLLSLFFALSYVLYHLHFPYICPLSLSAHI